MLIDYKKYAEEQGWVVSQPTLSPNLFKLKVNRLGATLDNARIINFLYFKLKSDPDFVEIPATPSGGISIADLNLPAFTVKLFETAKGTVHGMEIVILTGDYALRVQFTAAPKTAFSGSRAYFAFRTKCKKMGIDLDAYRISPEAGLAEKEKIPRPMILYTTPELLDRTFEGCHHVDFHSSYGAGLCNAYPEFRGVVEYYYQKRKVNENYKQLVNLTIGYFQSKYVKYRYAHLTRAAIMDNNRRLTLLAKALAKSGQRTILLYNTDGFWYLGPMYHGPGEGADIGEWHHDHVNCRLRIKGAGAYEFVENGKYYPVLRGQTLLDKVMDRTQWQWGDIYRRNALPIKLMWDEEVGFVEAGPSTIDDV